MSKLRLHSIVSHVGKFYDEAGNWNNKWTPESEAEYDKRAKCLIKQYDEFNIVEINTKVSDFFENLTYKDSLI